MFLNKSSQQLLLFLFFFFSSVVISAEAMPYDNMPPKISHEKKAYDFIKDLFTHLVYNTPFESNWISNFGDKTEDFFRSKIHQNMLDFKKNISFSGEFLRFQYRNILNVHDKVHIAHIYMLPEKSLVCHFNKQHRPRFVDSSLGDRVTESFVRLNVFKFGKERGIISFNFYLGMTRLNSGIIRLEYCEFLANNKLALEGRIPLLKNIPRETLEEYLKWLVAQQPIYRKIKKEKSRRKKPYESINLYVNACQDFANYNKALARKSGDTDISSIPDCLKLDESMHNTLKNYLNRIPE